MAVYLNQMVDPDPKRCVEAEVLAAFVEHGLSLTERARVEAHLAVCSDCLGLVASVARTVAELSAQRPASVILDQPSPLPTRRTLAGMLTAAAAVFVVLVAPSVLKLRSGTEVGLVNLVENVDEQRRVLGRLSGGTHAPLRVSGAGHDSPAAAIPRIQLAAETISETFGDRETPARLHALGVSQLQVGHYDDAIQSLMAAARAQPGNARYLNDVAAVQLERARLGLHPDDLPRALASADRARRIDPSLREAWFNRALAVTALSLKEQGIAAWQEYLERDGSSPWAAEARARLQDLQQPGAAEQWLALESRLHGSVDAALADEAVRTHVTEARNFIDRGLLPMWAAAINDGRDASDVLTRLRVMADAVARLSGDFFYRDVVNAIDRAEGTGVVAIESLAAAHLHYASAEALYSEDRFVQALPGLTVAHEEFLKSGSPFAHRAALDIATVLYANGRNEEAATLLKAVAEEARSVQHLYHHGRSAWVEGLIEFGQGRLGAAQASYEDALTAFERAKDLEQVAGISNLLASLHGYLGEDAVGWKYRETVLRALGATRSHRLQYQIVQGAAAAVRRHDLEAALMLQNAACEATRAWGLMGPIADSLIRKAEILHDLGRSDEARAALDEARAATERVSDPSIRLRTEIVRLSAESHVLRQALPERSAAAASRAIATSDQLQDGSQLPRLYLRLTKANLSRGAFDAAAASLADGIAAFDRQRGSIVGEDRISALDDSWGLFESAVHLAIKQSDLPRAFALAERGRSRTLVEALRSQRTLPETQAAVRSDQAVVALNQFDDELVVWVIRSRNVTVSIRPIGRVTAARLVARQHDEIRFEAAHPAASAALFDELLRPIASQLAGVSSLVFVPDAPYHAASFAGLWDARENRFLAEDLSVSTAPTIAHIGTSQEPARSGAVESALVVGRSDTRANAAMVASIYPRADILEETESTASAFMRRAVAHSVIHIGSSATANVAYPMRSRLRLSSGGGSADAGTLSARDIVAHGMPATRLVVLGSDMLATADTESASSLARIFLSAGVGAVLGTLAVADESVTRQLILDVHRQVSRGLSPGQALSTVQRNVLQRNGRRLGAWSALVLYGSDR